MDGTVAVGSFAANPFGLYDMHGNVCEWVEDCWHWNYEGTPTDGSAWTTGCDIKAWAVLRDGGWLGIPQTLRSAQRGGSDTWNRISWFGFRLVQDISP